MRHVDLAVIGSGSGNSIINEKFSRLSVALIDDGDHNGSARQADRGRQAAETRADDDDVMRTR